MRNDKTVRGTNFTCFHAGPKEGRLRLLRATRTQLSPVFLLYRDAAGVVARTLIEHAGDAPEIDVVDPQGTRHRLWRVCSGHDEVTAAEGAGKLSTSVGLFLPRNCLFSRRNVSSPASSTSTCPLKPTAACARCRKRVRPDLENRCGSATTGLLGGSMLII